MHLKHPVWKVFLALAIFCALSSEFLQHVLRRSPLGQVESAQKQIQILEGKMKESLGFISAFRTDSQFHRFFIHSGQQEHGFSFFYFEDGILKYWSDHEIVLPENIAGRHLLDGTVLNLPNGIYLAYEKLTGNKKITGLILLRKNFSYENRYLTNHFNPVLGLDNQFEAVTLPGDYQLKSVSGGPLMALLYSPVIPDEQPFTAASWFYLLAYFLLLSAVFFFFIKRKAGLAEIFIVGISLLLLRFLMIRFRLPGELYYSDFFSPKVYGSSFFFNSLGDLLLNSYTLLAFAGIFYSRNKSTDFFRGSSKAWPLLVIIPALVLLFYMLHSLLSDLVLTSKITFDATITEWDASTLAATLSMMFLLWSFYFIAAGAVFRFWKMMLPRPLKKLSWFPARLRHAGRESRLVALLVLAVYTSVTIHNNTRKKKLENQKLFAQRLDSRQDQLAEFLFEDVQKKIIKDTLIRQMAMEKKDVAEKITRHVQQNYLTGYFTRFDATISVYDSTGISYDPSSVDSLSVIREKFTDGQLSGYEKLMLQPDATGKLKYLSLLPIADAEGNPVATISVLLSSRSTQLSEGFPELLVSNRVVKSREESTYSYARYSEGSLIYAGGNYPYAFQPASFQKSPDGFSAITMDDFEHVIYKPSDASLVIVSRPTETFFDQLSLFSYVLLFFLSAFLAAYLLLYFIQNKTTFHLSLKQRIRSSIVFLVIISFVLIAGGTSVYIVRKYDADKNKNILSTLNAMWFTITDHLIFERGLSSTPKTEWTRELQDIVSNFNLDFNLYDETGNLYYSSQPKLFEKGILSLRINPEALFEMRQHGKTQFVHTENIGRLSYAAAYAPFTDRTGNIAGYVNLPYFEKQNELNREISGFLSALINIYLFLMVVSILLALLITSRITKPLLLIQEKLSVLRLGSRNERIEWKRNDEIGQLVRQYNNMVEALAESAEKLTRSERESAWREMAQQVAHEIKNPLTPMKLSVQHLQRAWNEKSGNLNELFQRISKTLIEQIDTLSMIASEFSNFAKMPRIKNEILDLNELLRSVVNLFVVTPGIEIHYKEDPVPRPVFADREQLSRAFSNLIKNAVQAIPENRKGKISISIKTENDRHLISIADNGTGIPSGLQSKIFSPNFTTKTSGMGLGLAMVKSALEISGGTIRFETTEGTGSVFHISLPTYTPEL